MELEMDRQLIQGIWGYHWWGNRQHFDEVAALGEETARQEVGKQFSFPTLKGMLAHIYGADWIWFERWKSASPTRLYGDADFHRERAVALTLAGEGSELGAGSHQERRTPAMAG